jgi:formylglycine-generating enzyme required for sulfatase activity
MSYRVIVPPVLVAVPGGTFNNGVADMTVSAFSLGKYEVTWEQWRCVKYWPRPTVRYLRLRDEHPYRQRGRFAGETG